MKLKLISDGKIPKLINMETGEELEKVVSINYTASVNGYRMVVEILQDYVDIQCDNPEIVYIRN